MAVVALMGGGVGSGGVGSSSGDGRRETGCWWLWWS